MADRNYLKTVEPSQVQKHIEFCETRLQNLAENVHVQEYGLEADVLDAADAVQDVRDTVAEERLNREASDI